MPIGHKLLYLPPIQILKHKMPKPRPLQTLCSIANYPRGNDNSRLGISLTKPMDRLQDIPPLSPLHHLIQAIKHHQNSSLLQNPIQLPLVQIPHPITSLVDKFQKILTLSRDLALDIAPQLNQQRNRSLCIREVLPRPLHRQIPHQR